MHNALLIQATIKQTAIKMVTFLMLPDDTVSFCVSLMPTQDTTVECS